MVDSADKIKIAFVVWTLEGMAGAEKVVYDIARKLDKEIFSIIIISFKGGCLRAQYEDLGIKVFVLSKKRKVDFGLLTIFHRIITNENIAIINAHHFPQFFYSFLASRRTKVKLVFTEHSRWQLEQLSPTKRIINKYFLKKTEAVVAISKQIEDYYLNRLSLNKTKVHLIINGIDLDIYKQADPLPLRKELEIGADEMTIGMIANLRPEKNHKLLVSAFMRVAKDVPNTRLVFAGLDCMNGQVQRYVAEKEFAGKVLFLGQREDIPKLLSVFDIFCLTSFNEGLPLTVLEAMACGIPVIGSDVVGINEVIEDGVNGLLFPKDDEESLARGIKRLLLDAELRNRLSIAGRACVEKQYSLNDKIREYDDLFRHLYHYCAK